MIKYLFSLVLLLFLRDSGSTPLDPGFILKIKSFIFPKKWDVLVRGFRGGGLGEEEGARLKNLIY